MIRTLASGLVHECYLSQIRNVALLPGEWVNHVFCPMEGLVPEPPAAGQTLVATNQRILAFNLGDRKSDLFVAPLDDLRGVSLNPGVRSPGSVLQGTLLILGAMFIYLVLAYWLTGTFEGPNVPIINMDLGALVVLAAAIVGAIYIGRQYFTRQWGTVTMHGTNWSFTFPFLGGAPGREIYQVINSAFADRQANVNRSVGLGT